MPALHKRDIFFTVLIFCVLLSSNLFSQTDWIKYGENPVFTGGPPGSWNEDVGMPFVLFDGLTYHMWYTGTDSNRYTSYGYASSSDGIIWDDYAGNPVLSPGEGNSWDASMIETRCVIYDDSGFHMWYTGYNNNIANVHACIGYATSPDGKNWKKYGGNPVMTPIGDSWEEIAVGGPQVIKKESIYHLWYVGSLSYNIGYATSHDGITWDRYEGNPVMEHQNSLWPCQVILSDNNHQLWYQKGPTSDFTINLAVSSDGINWTPSLSNPVLEHGEQGSWDEAYLGTCSIVSIDSTYKMWYTARDVNGNDGIGYATTTPQSHDIKIISIFNNLKEVPLYCDVQFTPKARIMNVGLSDEFNVTVKCIVDSAGYEIYNEVQIIDTLKQSLVECEEVIFTPWEKMMGDLECNYVLKCFTSLATDQNALNDTLTSTFQTSNLIDDFESNLFKWTTDSCWALTNSSASSGLSSLRNTTKTFYDNDLNSSIEFRFAFDLSQLSNAHMSFWTKYFIETGKDFGYIEVSTDGGQIWIQLGDPFTGVQATWKEDSRSLNDFCGPGFDEVKLRFHFVSDSVAGHPMIGWSIDDVKIYPTAVSVNSDKSSHLPEMYSLANNYPNPFNSSTTLNYTLPEPADVKIAIFNLLGQELKMLIKDFQQPGKYTLRWNGNDLKNIQVPSGIYIYQMKTDKFIATKKMLYIK